MYGGRWAEDLFDRSRVRRYKDGRRSPGWSGTGEETSPACTRTTHGTRS